MVAQKRRLVILQYGGDFREALERLRAGGPETYFAQQYSVNTVLDEATRATEVVVITCLTDAAYDCVIEGGIRTIGLGQQQGFSQSQVVKRLDELRPSHIVFRALTVKAIRWAVRQHIPCICIFAESISSSSIRNRLRSALTARTLNSATVKWVGAYGISSAQGYALAGVRPKKIVPWDFFDDTARSRFSVKIAPASSAKRVLYVGTLSVEKGVGDLIEAIGILRQGGLDISLSLVGPLADSVPFEAECKARGLAAHVIFKGLVANSDLEEMMATFDAVIVPSRPSYPEGFPLVIAHALFARVPVVASDHPMFIRTLKNEQNAMLFTAGSGASLAASMQRLLTDDDLYRRLSENALDTWRSLHVPVKFADLLRYGFDHDGPGRQRLEDNTLTRLRTSAQ
jgi:hypothetical protein